MEQSQETTLSLGEIVNSNSFPLIYGKENETLQVTDVRVKRLEELGIVSGTIIKLIEKTFSGCLIEVGQSRYCLDKETVMKIKVRSI